MVISLTQCTNNKDGRMNLDLIKLERNRLSMKGVSLSLHVDNFSCIKQSIPESILCKV